MVAKKNSSNKFEPIAVIGVGSLFPGSLNTAKFWQNIRNGVDFIEDILPSHWLIDDYYDPDPATPDKTYCKRGAYLPTVKFDPVEFGIPPSVLPSIDTSQLLALMVAKQTFEDALGETYKEQDLSRVSVIIGSSTLEAIQYMAARLQHPIWTKSLREHGLPEDEVKSICQRISEHYTPLQENTFPGLLQNVIAGRIANRFDTGGANCVTDAACAGSLAALTMSVRELQVGACDMVITGGVDTLNDIVMHMCFDVVGALSPNGDCAPFSDKADGTVLGEGVGMFAIKRLSDAEANNDKIYGVIRGLGASSDGRSKSIYAPLSEGQSKAVLRAYDAADYDMSTIELLEGHGTGTKAWDLAEFQGAELAFKQSGVTDVAVCGLGSIKSQIGHTKSAAGSAGFLKTLMALHHKVLPPTIKIDQPNAAFDLEHSPIYLNTQQRPWVRSKDHPRRAGVSSFGFGGSNYHVAVEEYQGDRGRRAARLRTFDHELVTLSAEDDSALLEKASELQNSLNDIGSLSKIARETQTNIQKKHKARLAIVASSIDDLNDKLLQAKQSITSKPDQALCFKDIYYANNAETGKIMFLFPGQGSQYVGMSADVTMSFDAAMSSWDEAANIKIDKDVSLHDVVFPKPGFGDTEEKDNNARIMSTEWAQPALAAASVSYLRLMETLEIQPDYLSGHSFGELTALYAAGVMDEPTLIELARKRGELMRDASDIPGAMLSVFHPVEEVLSILKSQKLSATPANYNSPGQLVLSGSVEEIEKAKNYLKSQKIRCQQLQVATGFHSHLVEDGCKPLATYLNKLKFNKPAIPVFANTTGVMYPYKIAGIKAMLAKQLANPVRFLDQMQNAYKEGVRTFIEVGPKGVLTSLAERCLEGKNIHAIQLDKQGSSMQAFWQALGKLFSVGVQPNFNALWVEYDGLSVFDDTKTHAKFSVPINGTNYNRPYPLGAASTDNSPEPKPVVKKQQEKVPQTSSTEVKPMSQNNNAQMIQMIQNLQMQLINSHNHYQKVMAESHMAFLNSIGQLTGQTGGIDINAVSLPQMPVMPAVVTAPVAPVAPAPQPVVQQPIPPMTTPPPAVTTQQAPAVTPAAQAIVSEEKTVVEKVASEEVKSAPSAAIDLESLLLDVVVETTGYPKEMLSTDMSIEADLGIDSIKRVEILSIMVEKAPGLPEVDPADLGKLETLGDIIDYMKSKQN